MISFLLAVSMEVIRDCSFISNYKYIEVSFVKLIQQYRAFAWN